MLEFNDDDCILSSDAVLEDTSAETAAGGLVSAIRTELEFLNQLPQNIVNIAKLTADTNSLRGLLPYLRWDYGRMAESALDEADRFLQAR